MSFNRKSASQESGHRKSDWFRSLVLGCVAATQVAGPAGQLRAAPWSRAPKVAPAAQTEVQKAKTIKLFYVRSTWKKVLDDYAKATGLTVEVEGMPKKPFTHLEQKEYTFTEAYQLLNIELERLGFKLRIKGDKLIVLNRSTAPLQYTRPDTPTAANEIQKIAADDLSKHEPEEPRKFVSNEIRVPKKPEVVQTPRRRKSIQQASNEIEESENLAHDRVVAPEAMPAVPKELVTTAFKLEKKQAVPVAKMIFEGFKPNAELVNQDERGLYGFRVTGGKSGTQSRFSMSIDKERNQLLVKAPKSDVPGLSRLVEKLDAVDAPGKIVRAVATKKDAKAIALALQPQLDELAQVPKIVRVNGQQANEAAAGQPADPAAAPDTPTISVIGKGAGQVVVDDLKGEVDIEALSDLGVLIIKGNKEDVDKVMAIIRQIEELSIGTAPDIEILMLEHVSSEALSLVLSDVYSRLSNVRNKSVQQTQSVSIIPLVRPNAIMILASAADMDSVKQLAAELDKPLDPRASSRVFRLKSAVASQVATHIQELYPLPSQAGAAGQAQSATTGGLAPKVTVLADVRTNAVIVQARPRDLQEIATLIKNLDQGVPEAVSQIRIFQLKNATADEISATLQNAIQSAISPPRQQTGAGGAGGNPFAQLGNAATGNQGAQELRDAKSTVLQFISAQGPDEAPLRSGILADIRVTADARTNSVVVTAPEQSMELMAELINTFDRPSSAISDIKVFGLVNSDATNMLGLLQQLFQPTAQGGQGGQQQGQLGVLLAGAEDASSTLIPLKFSVDTRTNSIIAVGGGEALVVVEAILRRLDQSDIKQRQTSVYRLRNAPAADIAIAITDFVTARRDAITASQDLISPYELLEREVIVIPEPISNNLLISATPRYFDEIRDIVLKLDMTPQQVMIQGLLVEVALDNTDEFGIELGVQDSLLFSRSLASAPTTIPITSTAPNGVATTTQQIISQTSVPGFNFNNQALGNNIFASPTNFAGQAISNLAVARTNADVGYGGLVLSGGSDSLSVLLRALSVRRRIDILSRPQVTVMDNQQAQIQVGSQVPRVNGVNTNATTGVSTPLIEQKDVGIILQVTPRISPEGKVVMEVSAIKSAIQAGTGVSLITNPNGTTITSPIIDITTAVTTVSVNSGQTIVLGGMITKNENTLERKVPLLGDIPLLGMAFRYDSKILRRTELLIFLTPRVITSDYEAEQIKQVEMDRLHFIEMEAEQMHGPLRAYSDALECPPDGTSDVLQQLPTGGPAMQIVPGPLPQDGMYPGGMPRLNEGMPPLDSGNVVPEGPQFIPIPAQPSQTPPPATPGTRTPPVPPTPMMQRPSNDTRRSDSRARTPGQVATRKPN